MSYTVLAVKWRPRRFGELVGQQHVVQALTNSLAAERLHHAYLFSGTRGVGKTTVARILAKALNCEQGIVAEPCGTCETCRAIDEGRFVDLIEVDAASRTKVDDTRELLDNVQYAPTHGRFKVYLIDEVHMLSASSFNALLKTLEEPPPHVKFLLATTDPQKLPVTVLSRCLQFHLKHLGVGQIEAQLEKICAAEGVEAESAGLDALAKAADGSLRDALSMLDQAIAFGAGTVKTELVNNMLGTIDRGHVLRILETLAAGDGSRLLHEVEQLDELAPDYATVLEDLMSMLQQLAVLQLVGDHGSADVPEALGALAASISPEDVQLYYQIALQGRRDLPVARDQRMGAEMTLLRMLAFRPETATPPIAPARAPRVAAAPRETRPASRRATAAVSPPVAPPEPELQREEAAPADVRQGSSDKPNWAEWVRAAGLRGGVRQLADHCALVSESSGRLELVVSRDKDMMNTPQLRERLQSAMSRHLGRDITLNITAGNPPGVTPAAQRRQSEGARMRAAREAMETDPNVLAAQDAFGAVLEPDSIHPIDD